MDRIARWTTPEEAALREGRYWRSLSVTERVAAVEQLRQRTMGVYSEAAPRLERVYRFVELTPRVRI